MRARTFTHGWSRRRHGRVGSLAVVCLALVAAMLAAPSASAAVTSYFELEGDVLDNTGSTPPDWGAASGSNSIFSVANGVGVPRSPLPTNFFDAGFARDF